jgi:hypothetical protein
MKNLYKQARLKLFEDDPVMLSEAAKACENGADREAIEGILCIPERKAVYDRTVRTIHLVAMIQRNASIEPGSFDAVCTEFTGSVAGKSPNEAQATTGRPTRLATGFILFFILLIVFVAILLSQRETDDVEIIVPSEELDQANEQTKTDQIETWQERYYVTAQTLNVRSSPGIGRKIVAKVTRFDDLQVQRPLQSNTWAKVTTEDGIEGYVSINFIALGRGATAYQEYCTRSVTRVSTGHTFEKPADGRHSLNLESPANHDIAASLINKEGRTVFFGYVRAGEAYRFDNIPSGPFRFRFALGKNFSADCGLFTENMIVHENDNPIVFDPTLMDNDYVTSEIGIFFRN